MRQRKDKEELTEAEEERAEQERLKKEAAKRIARLEAQWRLYLQRSEVWTGRK